MNIWISMAKQSGHENLPLYRDVRYGGVSIKRGFTVNPYIHSTTVLCDNY